MSNQPGTPGFPGTRRQWLIAFALSTAVFVFGIVVGGTTRAHLVMNRAMTDFRQPGHMVGRMLSHLEDELDLTGEQKQQLESLLLEHAENINSLHEEFRPRMEEEFDVLRAQVEEILTPEQAVQWRARFDDMRERWLKPRGRGGRGDGGPGRRGGGRGPDGRGGGPRRDGPRHDGMLLDADRDGDGKVTREEMTEHMREMAEERFQHLDRNGDGHLSEEELGAGPPPPMGESPPQ